MVNRLDSVCHSNIRNIKLELLRMLTHQVIGIMHIMKSPHLPCDFCEVAILGANLSKRWRIRRENRK